jgi:hypothetical protein
MVVLRNKFKAGIHGLKALLFLQKIFKMKDNVKLKTGL